VVSVFQDPILELHTTRSWDFLDSDLGMKPPPATTHQISSTHDIIIALIDTGKYAYFLRKRTFYKLIVFCIEYVLVSDTNITQYRQL
jgi:hypothetical protein